MSEKNTDTKTDTKTNIKTVRILLVGYKSSGKTTYIKRLYDGDFHKQSQPTYNIGIYKFPNFDQQNIDVVLLDTSGEEKEFNNQIQSLGMIDGIICFKTYPTQKVHYMTQVAHQYSGVPIVYVSSFCDQPPHIDFRYVDYSKIEFPFYEISSKSCYQLAKPIHVILNKLQII